MKFQKPPQWSLRVVDDHGALAEIPVTQVPKCFGRSDDRVDIRLLSCQVSRRHAEISAHPDGSVTLKDLGSSNGTEVNGLRISGAYEVNHGDKIRIGRWEFEVCNAAQTDQGRVQVREIDAAKVNGLAWQPVPEDDYNPFAEKAEVAIEIETTGDATTSSHSLMTSSLGESEAPVTMVPADNQAIATMSGMPMQAVADFATDSHTGSSVFGGSNAGLPSMEDSYTGGKVSARAHDLHFVGEGCAPGVCAADLCAVQAFADRQLLVAQSAKRRRLLCEFTVGASFARNLSVVVHVGAEGKIEVVCGPVSSLPEGVLHIEKALVRKAAEEKRAVVAWDARFGNNKAAVALCCPLSGGEYLYSMTTFENATPAWMALIAQTAFMDRLIRKSWQAVEKYRQPASRKITEAA